MANRLDWRTEVADEMIRQIEAGTARWQQPWDPGAVRTGPFNEKTGDQYRGLNAWWLDSRGYSDPRWMTYKQAAAVGAQVRKGEKSTAIEYWQWTDKVPVLDASGNPVRDEKGEIRKNEVRLDRPRVFFAKVFNAEQIDGLAPYVAPKPEFEPIEKAEAVLAAGGVKIKHGKAEAFYSPAKDMIQLPEKAAFKAPYEYYSTALHELGHATGHKSRMQREFGPFGSAKYAEEELRAEMASFMVATEMGLGHYPDRHAGYVDSWMKAVKDDRNVLFRAAQDAERIRTWILEPEKRQALEQAAERRKEAMEKEGPNMVEQPERKPEQEQAARVFLSVPFEQKDEAKALGARWDRREKSWYMPPGVEREPLEKWLVGDGAKPGVDKAKDGDLERSNPIDEFASALDAHGLKLKGKPLMDGEWHRVSVEGDRGDKKSGSYRAFLDGVPNGQIVNFKDGGEPVKWVATGARIDPAEKERLKRESAERAKAIREERKATHKETAKKAFGVFKNAEPVTDRSHPYLAGKEVDGHELKVDKNGNLLVPMRDARGFLWNVQTIAPDGEKRFFTGGRKSGLMHVIDPEGRMKDGNPEKIVVSEGYATAATVHKATGLPTVVGFDAGNLESVVKAVHDKHPESKIVIAADNDHKAEKNVGVEKAAAAAEKVPGTKVIVPALTPGEKATGQTDYNDLVRSRGETVGAQAIRDDLAALDKVQKQSKAKRAGQGKGQPMAMAM